jgi:hypothetical protein
VIPGNVTHQAKILADSVAVEIFSPVREDFLPKYRFFNKRGRGVCNDYRSDKI